MSENLPLSRRLCSRRLWLSGVIASSGVLVLGLGRAAPPAEPVDPQQRRLSNRLELWSSFARQTENLTARYTAERSSSLLLDKLVSSGQLAFVAKDERLIMRDDGATGSTTRISRQALELTPNDPSLPRRPLVPPGSVTPPALRWLADHLLACFVPGDGQALIADARTEAPRGQLPRLTIMPLRESAVRALIRSVTLTLDPVGGAIQRIVIAEADGGQYDLRLVDHRQNVEPDELARVLEDH